MVRRTTAWEEGRVDRQICANVFGLWWRSESPGHDELRCVLYLINGTVMGNHFREQACARCPFSRFACQTKTIAVRSVT
jgi:hypothetical protein